MPDLFADGRIVDAALLLVAAEAVCLALWRRRRRPGAGVLLVNLASGACLMLALRAAIAGAPGIWLAAALAGAGAAHIADLWLRLRSAAR
ncbi:MAG: hypothetical protein PGN34_26170 [Methylobacterium frigidaeris]